MQKCILQIVHVLVLVEEAKLNNCRAGASGPVGPVGPVLAGPILREKVGRFISRLHQCRRDCTSNRHATLY